MGAPAAARSLHMVLVVAGVVCLAAILTVLLVFGGWEYYRAPLGTRGYLPAHPVLRPSGWVGLPLGIAGAAAMLSTLPYAARKRWTPLKKVGTVPGWLEAHIFFGIVGPVLVTLHTSFKFNGLISVGYWLMMAVWASGFVGRYLYVRIPKSIRGAELTRAEIDAQLVDVRTRLSTLPLPEAARAEIEAFEATLVTPNAPFDQFLMGSDGAMTDQEKRGLAAFMDEDLLAHALVWAAAGTPHAVFPADPRDLARAAAARIGRLR